MNKSVEAYSNLFRDLIGQKLAISLLKASLEKNQINNAYLFAGPEGVGRKLTALRFLEGVLNTGEQSTQERRRLESRNHPDLLWVEPTYLKQGTLIPQSKAKEAGINLRQNPQIRLEQIKQVTRFLAKKSIEAPRCMVIIESAENITETAANGLLKTLEEPLNGMIILVASRPERILTTIRSRCQQIPFTHLTAIEINQVLTKIQSNKESLKAIEKEFLTLANGSPGAFTKHLKNWEEIPKEIRIKIRNLPQSPIEALTLAKELTDALDIEQQLWLIHWLQQRIWREKYDRNMLEKLEKLQKLLKSYVQPRLAWEITLLELISID